jgi:hypothetical protein
VLGVVLLATDEADLWMGLLVLALAGVTAAGAIMSRR